MVAEYDEAEAVESVRDDWQHDSGGADCLTREMFMDCVFELADVWTRGLDPEEYGGFLDNLLGQLAKGGQFVPDADIVPGSGQPGSVDVEEEVDEEEESEEEEPAQEAAAPPKRDPSALYRKPEPRKPEMGVGCARARPGASRRPRARSRARAQPCRPPRRPRPRPRLHPQPRGPAPHGPPPPLTLASSPAPPFALVACRYGLSPDFGSSFARRPLPGEHRAPRAKFQSSTLTPFAVRAASGKFGDEYAHSAGPQHGPLAERAVHAL